MTPPSGAAPKRKPNEERPAETASAAEKSRASAPAKPPHTLPPARMSHAEVRTIFFGLMLAAFLAALNQTIIATALPTIGRHFADFENLSWVVTAYLLTSTAVAPLYGKLSDIYGRRAMMLTAVGLFIAGSALCAAAPNMMTADPRPRPARHRRRRHPAALPVGDRRRGRAARARPLPGLHGRGVGDLRRRRAGAGRRAGRASALVADLLAQRAARTCRGAADPHPSQAHPAPRPHATSSTCSAPC